MVDACIFITATSESLFSLLELVLRFQIFMNHHICSSCAEEKKESGVTHQEDSDTDVDKNTNNGWLRNIEAQFEVQPSSITRRGVCHTLTRTHNRYYTRTKWQKLCEWSPQVPDCQLSNSQLFPKYIWCVFQAYTCPGTPLALPQYTCAHSACCYFHSHKFPCRTHTHTHAFS